MGPWAISVPIVLVSGVGLLLNAYVLFVVIALSKQTQQQQTANTLLLIHLGAVEAAVCLVLLIFSIGAWPAAGTWCVIHGFLLALLHPVALWTVTGLNCDRYYAIAAPLHYTHLVSPRRVVLGLAISWAGALLLCLPPFSGLVPPYRYVPGLGCCAPDFGNGGWGSAGTLYGAIYAFLGLALPALLVTVCNLRVLGIARYHRHRIASAIYEVTLSAQVTITHQRNPFFVPAVTAPAAGGPPRFHSAASTVMQLVGSLYLLYFPYCGLILWEACGGGSSGNLTSSSSISSLGSVVVGVAAGGGIGNTLQQQPRLHAHPRFASLASLLLACSPPINGLLYGLKSRTLRRSVQNYWRKKATKSELQQEIQARTPSAAGSRRPSGSGPASSFFPFPPLQRRLSEALLALGNCRAGSGFGSGNIAGVFQRSRLQPAASCNTLRVPNTELVSFEFLFRIKHRLIIIVLLAIQTFNKPCLTRKRMLISASVFIGLILIIIVISSLSGAKKELVPDDPEQQPPPSWSKLRTFKRGAVCADGPPCALIGKTILDRGGSAVDAAIAAMICNGLVNLQSMGFGGGFLMTIYDKEKNQAITLNARDAAPGAAHEHMFDGKPEKTSQVGALAMAVPGEVAGYWEAHQRFGKLPWAELFKPNIELCERGYNLSKVQHGDLSFNSSTIHGDPSLKELFVDPATGEFYKPGTVIKPKKLCETMRIIAEKNATELYNGTLGRMLVEDLRKRGSIITMQDLNNYRAKWQEPVTTTLYDGTKVYTTGIPGSGNLLTFMLNVLDEYHLTPNDIANTSSTIKTYHRFIETFKYAFGLRTHLGDVKLPALLKNLTSKDYARSIRMKINDTRTYDNPAYYGAENSGNTEDHGTAHIAVMAENGDAVSVTSSINIYFGCGVMSERTGILMNSGMDDFGLPGSRSYFGIPANKNNYIEPGKRPLSSMSPSILVDGKGDVKMTIGAAGGTKITTSMTYVIARHIWLGNTVKEAVDAPRIHHQLFPMQVAYEFGVPKPILEGLKALGHKTSRYRDRGSVICLLVKNNGTIYANADFRKGGDVYGIE